ncbi:MAG: oligosaccharide flippase family protein [Prevotellaceae bacterium]|jgi:O-antigen/teichoic acid export membrane protein|nr:oligosaccharide flippase family protein [Prevotellaceae bacterium]
MAKGMKSLAKDTAIYGISSIVGKFLNWLLVPLYTYVLASPADYGVVTNLYSWTALLLVILTYGMETGYFRFANKHLDEADSVYSTSLFSVGSTSLFFAMLVVIFSNPIARGMGYAEHPEYISMLAVAVAIDAFASIPFAYLRFKKRPVQFATLKMVYVVLNIIFNIFFLIVCPWLMKHFPASVNWFYNPDYGVGYVFVSNIISTVLQTLILLPFVTVKKYSFNSKLLKEILAYSLPLLILGIAGIMNQTLDKILFPFLLPGEYGASQLGIYGATSKIALVMLMFTQAFRYAYEPFIFAQNKDKDSLKSYADAMKYFIIFSLIIFLGMVLYIDIFKLIIKETYWVGLNVVPIVLFSFIFQGIYFNLSLWYKLTDKTMYGAWFSMLGTVIIVVGNILLVPQFSYMGSAWAAFTCYFVIMLVSYYFGQKYMPIKYELKRIGIYALLALVIFFINNYLSTPYLLLNYLMKTIILVIFAAYILKKENLWEAIKNRIKIFRL